MRKKLLFLWSLFAFSVASAQIGIVQPPNQQICSAFGTYGVFDLSLQAPLILGSLNPSDYTITYHTTQANATSDANSIALPGVFNGTNNQAIYVRVEETANPTNFELTSFALIVKPAPAVYGQQFTACDFLGDPNDGLGMVDLEEIAEQIYSFGSLYPADAEITFFASQSDAENQTNGLDSPYSNSTVAQDIYARVAYYSNNCATVIPVTLVYNNCGGLCIEPTNLVVSNIASTNATFSWTPVGTETQWELLVLYAGGPFPLPTMDGIVVNSIPATITGLECPESFDVYVRARCGATDISDWSEPLTFSTQNCNSGEPVNLQACSSSGSACFDLTVNNANVLGTQNPADFNITYHMTAPDAAAGTLPITNPAAYCVGTGTSTIYVRVYNVIAATYTVQDFTITATTIVSGTTVLQPMVQCDEDTNGTVVFDLTTAGAQLATTNPIAFYGTQANALSGTNPILNPSAFSVSTATALTTVYIRETVLGGCDILHTLQVNALQNCNLSNICGGANSLCNTLGVPFPNTTGIVSAEVGNNYGCMDETPNPNWFYLPVSASGSINLMIEQSSTIDFADADLDIDFICYGPFTSPTAPCNGLLTANTIADCSYSGNLVEYVNIPNATAGQFYIIMTSNYTDAPGYIRISETGSSTGEIDCTGLRLNAFIDLNSNGIKDSGEANFTLGQFHYERNGDSQIHNITSPTGIHRIYDLNPANLYDLNYTIDSAYTAYYNVTTPSYTGASIVSGAGLQEYNFPVTVTQSYNDLAIALIPEQQPRPGFTYTNTIVYTNLGTQAIASGTVTFIKDALLTITANSQAGVVDNATGFTYNFTNLQPFESRIITVTMQVPTIPTVALGNLLTNTASIASVETDAAPENNTAMVSEEIIGSFDPNDKMESHGEQILFSDFTSEDYLYYTIRFENTGTASAINVRVSDMLDSRLDETSVSMVRASHNYTLDRVEGQLTWRFENIQLPPTSQDAIGSHGYVHFKVKPKPGYAIGDVIPNTASIFFDFNPAIVTNTFETRFVAVLALNEFEKNGFAVYPNPANDIVNVSLKNDSGLLSNIAVTDLLGKTVFDKTFTGTRTSETVDLKDMSAGIYFIEITTSSNSKAIKKLIKK